MRDEEQGLSEEQVGGAGEPGGSPVLCPVELAGAGAQEGELPRITAAVDAQELEAGVGRDLERRLARAEAMIAALQAAGQEPAAGVRKTLPASAVQLLAKSGVEDGESVATEMLDRALRGMSVEQRIAVKTEMLRSGMLLR